MFIFFTQKKPVSFIGFLRHLVTLEKIYVKQL